MSSVSVRRVKKSYGEVQVVHGVDVDVNEGEFTVLVGPSGCGKSTLLRMIAGLEKITGGEIWIGDRLTNNVEPKDRNIAMVFQNYALYPHMTVAEIMGFSLKVAGRPASEIQSKVREAAQILQIGDLLDRYPRQLSGGQRQRVATGRAIVRSPEVFLFDEPLSNLDAQLRVTMRAEIRDLHRKIGSTMIYVTHDQVEAMTMADKIVVMKDGRVEQIGSPLDLYDRPANRFVAQFIGSPSMNIVEGQLIPDAGRFRTVDGQDISLNDRPAGAAEGPALLGVRPDSLRLSDDGLAARIIDVETLGSEVQILAGLGADGAGSRLSVILRERAGIRPGQPIHLSPAPGALHFFSPQSGERL